MYNRYYNNKGQVHWKKINPSTLWLPGGIHDTSPKVTDESEGLWAKGTEGLHC